MRGEHAKFIKFLEGRPEWKRLIGRPRRRWDYSIKIHLQKGEYEGAGWIHIGQDPRFSSG